MPQPPKSRAKRERERYKKKKKILTSVLWSLTARTLLGLKRENQMTPHQMRGHFSVFTPNNPHADVEQGRERAAEADESAQRQKPDSLIFLSTSEKRRHGTCTGTRPAKRTRVCVRSNCVPRLRGRVRTGDVVMRPSPDCPVKCP